MKKFKLLLLDTNVVIKALELNLWQKLIEPCDIWLADSVIQEAVFFTTDDGIQHSIDLSQDINENRITKFELQPSELTEFRRLSDPSYFEKLDDGETESLAFLINSPEEIIDLISDNLGMTFRGHCQNSTALPWKCTVSRPTRVAPSKVPADSPSGSIPRRVSFPPFRLFIVLSLI